MADQRGNSEKMQQTISFLNFEAGRKKERTHLQIRRVLEVLRGEVEGVVVFTSDEGRNPLGPAVDEVPHVGYTDELEGMELNCVADLGHYVVSNIMENDRPGDVFNAAFIAGALAVQEGRVDAEALVEALKQG